MARSCDISETGAGIFTTDQLPVGARLFLEVLSSAGKLSAIGKITHCSDAGDGTYRIGIQLEIVPPTDRATLAKLLASGTKTSEDG